MALIGDTKKRFQRVFIKDNELEFQDNGIVKRFNNYRLEEFLNKLNDENEKLKKEKELLARFIRRNHDVCMVSRILKEDK